MLEILKSVDFDGETCTTAAALLRERIVRYSKRGAYEFSVKVYRCSFHVF